MRNRFLFFLGFIICFLVLSYLFLYFKAGSQEIVISIRIPRFLLTLVTGFILAGLGYVYQIVLNNPLAEPYILGISSGAAFGSILAAVSGLFLLMPLFGFIGAVLTMFLVWQLARLGGFFSSTKLLLSGIIVGLFFSALISVIMYFNQKDIGNIINVLMGNLGHVFSNLEWTIFRYILIVSLVIMLYLFSQSEKINIISTGDEIATSLGVNVTRLRKLLFLLGSLLTGVVVAYAGIIGFVGLIVPHIVRILTRGNKRYNLILSACGGAFFLLFCDFIAMHLTIVELPVGIITSFLGCPFFVFILVKNK